MDNLFVFHSRKKNRSSQILISLIMMIINQQEKIESPINRIEKSIKQTMNRRSATLIKSNLALSSFELLYEAPLSLSRTKMKLSVLYSFKGSRHNVILDLSASTTNPIYHQQLKSLLNSEDNHLYSLLLISQINLSKEEGTFIFTEEKGIILKISLQHCHLFSDSSRLVRYLISKIQKSCSVFSRQLQRFFSLSQQISGNTIQLATSKRLKEEEDNIVMFEQVIQKNRQLRPKSSKVNLTGLGVKIIAEAIALGIQTLKVRKITPNQLAQSQQFYQTETEGIKTEFRQFQTVIVQGIQIKSILKEEIPLCQGGFAKILKGIFHVAIYPSVNPGYSMQHEQKSYCHLVHKLQIGTEHSEALSNQRQFLHNVRDDKCPYIARYYLLRKHIQSDLDEIFLDHYPLSFAQATSLRETQIIKIISEICRGLFFLNQRGIIHRDIKPQNIMLDKGNTARIIDFGSTSSIIWTQKDKCSTFQTPIDQRLCSTEGYYLSYKAATAKCPSIGSKFTKREFQKHQSFDVYSIGIIIERKMMLNFPVKGDFLRQKLEYLSKKCQQPNPEDRPTPNQIAVLLKMLASYSYQRLSVWNFAQRKVRQLQREPHPPQSI